MRLLLAVGALLLFVWLRQLARNQQEFDQADRFARTRKLWEKS